MYINFYNLYLLDFLLFPLSDPCQNEGHCYDKVEDYDCVCPKGFSGKSCELNYDDCGSDPCQNGGTCFDLTDVSPICLFLIFRIYNGYIIYTSSKVSHHSLFILIKLDLQPHKNDA